MGTIRDITIHDISLLSKNCEEAKREALQLMLKGDLDGYFKKILEVSHLQEELTEDLAA